MNEAINKVTRTVKNPKTGATYEVNKDTGIMETEGALPVKLVEMGKKYNDLIVFVPVIKGHLEEAINHFGVEAVEEILQQVAIREVKAEARNRIPNTGKDQIAFNRLLKILSDEDPILFTPEDAENYIIGKGGKEIFSDLEDIFSDGELSKEDKRNAAMSKIDAILEEEEKLSERAELLKRALQNENTPSSVS